MSFQEYYHGLIMGHNDLEDTMKTWLISRLDRGWKSEAVEVELLRDALLDMLNQFGENYSLSAVENACQTLHHPRVTNWVAKDQKVVGYPGDACYCRHVVYCPFEAGRRRKLGLAFVDKSQEALK